MSLNRAGKSLAISLVALSGCALDQYSFNGRDGSVEDAPASMDRAGSDATDDGSALPDVMADGGSLPDAQSQDGRALDASDGGISRPDASPDASACDPSELVPDNAVYVDGSRMVPGDGSSFNPFQTIAEAISSIEAARVDRPIVLAPSVYGALLRFENTARNHRIIGGFVRSGGAWSRSCTTAIDGWIIGGNGDQSVFIAGTAAGTVTFERVAFRTRATPPAGVSQYGLWVGTTREVLLREVDVLVSRGGAGSMPMAPSMTAGTAACDRMLCDTTANAGRVGNPGTNGGAARSVGTVNATMGFVPSNGTQGGIGSPGYAGTRGGAGTPLSTMCASCSGVVCGVTCEGIPQPSCGAQMQRRCSVGAATLTATAGQCGCGGNAGLGGVGGGGGYAAIALFVAPGANVRIENSIVRAGPGGNGAIGSVGGLGATGGPGAMGTAQACETQCDPASTPCNCISRSGTTVRATPGSMGGAGGSGGSGGAGGAGAGGSSIVIARSSTATVRTSGNVMLVPGAPGIGATGPSGVAVNGVSATEQMF